VAFHFPEVGALTLTPPTQNANQVFVGRVSAAHPPHIHNPHNGLHAQAADATIPALNVGVNVPPTASPLKRV
ncbi:hypothetical protein BS423_10870, partial [Cronobacter sakazakii]